MVPPAWACEGWSYRPTEQFTGVAVLVTVWAPVTSRVSALSTLLAGPPTEVIEKVTVLVFRPFSEPTLPAAGSLRVTAVPAANLIVFEHSRRA